MNDEDAFNDDFRVACTKGKRKSYEIDHESLSVDAIENAIRKEAEHVVGIFGVDVRPYLSKVCVSCLDHRRRKPRQCCS